MISSWHKQNSSCNAVRPLIDSALILAPAFNNDSAIIIVAWHNAILSVLPAKAKYHVINQCINIMMTRIIYES